MLNQWKEDHIMWINFRGTRFNCDDNLKRIDFTFIRSCLLWFHRNRNRIGFLITIAIWVSIIPGYFAGDEELNSFGVDNHEIPDELKLFQQMPLVITAARKPQRITEAPSTIDVITAEEIKRSGALTLSELLERLPGIYTPIAHNSLDMLWIRGVGGRSNDNALLLIDGTPYRTLYLSNFPINEQIPLEDIKKIEIIRGPGSALYGSNAFSGVVNIITKNVVDMRHNEISSSYGTYDTQNHYVFMGKEFENGEISFFAKYLDSNGYDARRDDEGIPTDNRRGIDNKAYKLKLKYKNFDFNFRYSKSTLDNFTVALDEGENGDKHTREHILSQLGFHQDISPKLSIHIKAYFNYFDFESSGIAQDENLDVTEVGRAENYGRVAGIDLLSTAKFSDNHTLLLGINYEYEYLNHSYLEVSEPPGTPFALREFASESGGDVPESISNSNFGVYLEDELKLSEQVILTSGLRFDSFEASDSNFSPRISLVYTPSQKTAIKLRYGEGFRAPTFQQLYKQVEDGEGEGNKNLSPQTIKTGEFEISQFLSDNHRLNATFYYSGYEKFIKVLGDGDFENLSKRDFYGLEIGLNGNISKNLSYFTNYSFTEAQESNGTDVGGVPKNMGNIGFTYTGLKFVEIVPHVRIIGRRNRPFDYQEDVAPENRKDLLGGYSILNLTMLFKNLPGPMTASLSVRNLLDETYHTPGEETQNFDIRQPGRRILLKVSLEF